MAETSEYLVERKLTLADIGVADPPASGADSSGSIRAAFGKLGDAWVVVGKAEAHSGKKAMEVVLGKPEDVVSGLYRATASRYVGDPIQVAAVVQTTLTFGAGTAPVKPAAASRGAKEAKTE